MIPTNEDLKRLPRVRFPNGNKIRYMQDHMFSTGIPDHDWWIQDMIGDWVSLVAPGHGTKEKYGNGAIAIPTSAFFPSMNARIAADEESLLAQAENIRRRRAAGA